MLAAWPGSGWNRRDATSAECRSARKVDLACSCILPVGRRLVLRPIFTEELVHDTDCTTRFRAAPACGNADPRKLGSRDLRLSTVPRRSGLQRVLLPLGLPCPRQVQHPALPLVLLLPRLTACGKGHSRVAFTNRRNRALKVPPHWGQEAVLR
jgi:hypothetical protein